MAARSSSRFAALFAVILVVVALVAWLALGLEKHAADDSAEHAVTSGTESAATTSSSSTQLAETKSSDTAAPSMRAKAPPTLAKDDAGPTAAELSDAWWVHGRVTFPEGTPLDERVFVVAQGKEFGKKKLYRVAVAPDGTFRVAFSKSTKNGLLRLEGRYVYLPESERVKPTDADKDVVLSGQLGGALAGRVVPSAGAQPFVADLVGSTITATGWKNGMNGPRMVTSTVGETLEFELGGLDPDMQWGVVIAPKGFSQTYATRPAMARAKITPFDLKVERGGRVSGIVRDAAGAPIEGVQLQTESRGEDGMGLPSNVTTDKSGAFTLDGMRSGKVRIDARKLMYVPLRCEELEIADGQTRTDFPIVLQRGNSVAGVVKWKDGKPAGGVRVEVVEPRPSQDEMAFWGLGDQTPSLKSNGDGTFTISGLRDGPYTVTAKSAPKEVEAVEATAKKEKRTPKVRYQAQVDNVAANSNALVLVLDSGNVVRGRVHDDRGGAVDAFTVKAEPAVDPGERWSMRASWISRDFSETGGTFELYGLADGEWNVHVETKNGPKTEDVSVTLPRDEQVLDFVLARTAKLRGVVLDAGGVPVAGALIEATLKDAEREWNPNRNEKSRLTHADGAFEIDVSPGELLVRASHSGWASSERLPMSVAPAQAAGPVTLVLRRGARITGDVLDKAGKPESGRSVSLWTGDYDESAQGTSDANGKFVIEHVTPGKATLNLEPSQAEMEANRKPDGSYSWSTGRAFNSQLEVVLEDGGTVHVSLGGASKEAVRVFGVVRAGEPVAGVTVSLNRRDQNNSYGDQREAVTGADGRYELTLDGPGEYSASFRTEHGGNAWINCTVPAGSSFELNATLPVGRISGRVVSDQGKPVAGVQVMAQTQSRHGNEAGELQAGFGNVQTAADGTFEIETLSAGTYVLTAQPMHWGRASQKSKSTGTARLEGVELEAGGNVKGIELRMPRGGSVRGTVIGPNGPVVGAQVTANSKEQSELGQSDETDATGKFQIDGLNPGTVVLIASSEDAASRPSAPIEIRPDETAEVELRLQPSGKIRISAVDAQGKITHAPWLIVDADGKPCPYFPATWADPETSDKGWLVGPMPAGKYTVTVGEGEHKVDREVDLAAGATEDVHVQFQ